MLLFAPVKDLLLRSWDLSLRFLTAVVIFVAGWLVATLIKAALVKVLKTLRLDSISEQARIAEFLSKGGIKHTLSEIIGIILYWVIIVGVLISSLNILALTGVSDLLDRILRYLPNVLGAMIVLILGALVSALVASIVRTAAANVGFAQANLLSKVAQVAIIVFAVLIALDALHIARILLSAMNIILGSIGLAVALAFGLGCKDIAADFASNLIEKLKKK
jgi:hypothetical protein